jgi:hydroxymethylbilane synthase
MKCIKIGTRGSALALWQTNWVRNKLEGIFPDCKFEVIRIQTQGDKVSDVPLESIGGEGVFVKQIEIALLDGEIDLAVHSMKDLPTVLPDGLIIGAIPERSDPADVLISKQNLDFSHLPEGAKIGTGSLRRRAQLLHARSDLTIRDIRGNVDTRLAKLRSQDLDAVVLASAGVERLGIMETRGYGDAETRGSAVSPLRLFSASLFAQRLPYEISLPAVGQGAIGVEVRAEDKELRDMVKDINHSESAATVRAERAFLRSLGGGCRVPIAALGTVDSGELELVGLVAQRDGRRVMRSGTSGRQEKAEDIGKRLAELLLDMGARSILDFGF